MNSDRPDVKEMRAQATSRYPFHAVCIPVLVSLAVIAILLETSAHFPMVWDEGYTVRREQLLDAWFQRAGSAGGWRTAFTRLELAHYWPFSREEPHGHPPFYALLGLAGWRLGRHWLSGVHAYRAGPVLLASVTAGLIYNHLARRTGRIAGALAAFLFIAMPRLFAHAHYAHYDMPMTCLWLIAQMAFVAGLDAPLWGTGYGLALGLAAATKFTGFFAVVPGVCWVAGCALLSRLSAFGEPAAPLAGQAWAGFRTVVMAVPVAVLTMYAIQPPWWIEPVTGPLRFLESNLTRSRTQPLPTLYLGTIHDFSLPWHNTIVLTAVTTPVTVLLLAIAGIACCLARSRSEPWRLIWPLSWITLMVVRSLPIAPGHDGVRLFLPSVASLAILAGMGATALAEWQRPGRRLLVKLLLAATAAECAVGIIQTYPYTDSYFNFAAGGLPGAQRIGFELTYYWETAGRELWEWAAAQAHERPVTLAFAMDASNHDLMKRWGEIPPGVRIVDLNAPATGPPDKPDYYVQQVRRGLWYPDDQWLDEHGHPVFAIRRQGVELLRVYTQQEFAEAARQAGRKPVRRALLRP